MYEPSVPKTLSECLKKSSSGALFDPAWMTVESTRYDLASLFWKSTPTDRLKTPNAPAPCCESWLLKIAAKFLSASSTTFVACS